MWRMLGECYTCRVAGLFGVSGITSRFICFSTAVKLNTRFGVEDRALCLVFDQHNCQIESTSCSTSALNPALSLVIFQWALGSNLFFFKMLNYSYA